MRSWLSRTLCVLLVIMAVGCQKETEEHETLESRHEPPIIAKRDTVPPIPPERLRLEDSIVRADSIAEINRLKK
jgi:hypothetical protein